MIPQSTPDIELVQLHRAGEKGAYPMIVQRYQDMVFSLCLRWMGRDRAIAEEVAQDVFVALFKSLEGFRGDAKLKTWIYRVTINHCKNRKTYRHRRKMERHETLEGRAAQDGGPVREFADDNAQADAPIHRSQAANILKDALAELPPEQRQMIIMRDVQDLDYEEISEILQIPRGTVKSRLHRARAELARTLKRQNITAKDLV